MFLYAIWLSFFRLMRGTWFWMEQKLVTPFLDAWHDARPTGQITPGNVALYFEGDNSSEATLKALYRVKGSLMRHGLVPVGLPKKWIVNRDQVGRLREVRNRDPEFILEVVARRTYENNVREIWGIGVQLYRPDGTRINANYWSQLSIQDVSEQIFKFLSTPAYNGVPDILTRPPSGHGRHDD